MAPVSASIGLDVGGTRIKGGVVRDGGLVAEHVVDVADKSQAAMLDAIVRLVDVLDPVGARDGALPIGIAAAGVIDQRRGVVRESPNFPAWRDFALGAELAARTGRRVELDNDANAVILGEARFGVARGSDFVFGYTLGTGVGGGIVIDGRPYRGQRGMAAELGHVTVVPGGRPCPCGNRGCLERYAGLVGILATLAEAGPPLSDLVSPAKNDPADLNDAPRRLAELAARGDPAARDVFAGVGRALGQAAAAALHTLDIPTIVLAGGIAGAAPFIVPAMHEALVAHAFRSMSEGVRILVGTLGTAAGVLGAAALAAALHARPA